MNKTAGTAQALRHPRLRAGRPSADGRVSATGHPPRRDQRQSPREAALVLDADGRIAGANAAAAALLRREQPSLLGQALATILPHLPLACDTPGYNLAYAVFQGLQPCWQRQNALAPDGRRIALDVQLASARVHGSRFITLGLRPALRPCGASA
ncbi:MAG: hypothetical protein FGM55_03535 [Rhodoferax sp.]|nr:hypothetical protein [Rhodoferax sp.]